eukprot:TRINITY_DN1982_c0_g1_i2.p1 TRINITY_DN1982_c0_g1~~TRINITY_DN1982_c0_g1_i2.p1  ORF type:complete len:388 (-),score=-18.22 TRINITY_DN1982_c0_g1_i2:9-1172(-)
MKLHYFVVYNVCVIYFMQAFQEDFFVIFIYAIRKCVCVCIHKSCIQGVICIDNCVSIYLVYNFFDYQIVLLCIVYDICDAHIYKDLFIVYCLQYILTLLQWGYIQYSQTCAIYVKVKYKTVFSVVFKNIFRIICSSIKVTLCQNQICVVMLKIGVYLFVSIRMPQNFTYRLRYLIYNESVYRLTLVSKAFFLVFGVDRIVFFRFDLNRFYNHANRVVGIPFMRICMRYDVFVVIKRMDIQLVVCKFVGIDYSSICRNRIWILLILLYTLIFSRRFSCWDNTLRILFTYRHIGGALKIFFVGIEFWSILKKWVLKNIKRVSFERYQNLVPGAYFGIVGCLMYELLQRNMLERNWLILGDFLKRIYSSCASKKKKKKKNQKKKIGRAHV